MISISIQELEKLYREISLYHRDYLAKYDVSLPKLRVGKGFTKDSVVLCILFKYFRKPVSKKELTSALSDFLNEDINDVQQARHLGRQKGWYILTGTRGDILPDGLDVSLSAGDYCLASVEKPYPSRLQRSGHHRTTSKVSNFDELKAQFGFRCSTCGSIEGDRNFKNPSRITKLQAGHQNPNLPLEAGNIIPQCNECNQAYRDWFVFDGSGRVIDINIDAPRWQKKYKLV